ncbi:MAG: hypothetical protein H0T89_20365 [Deltaproteobacteria bacterium]|nr:hypothetical protein [Deltaproteobacteria bacterium]
MRLGTKLAVVALVGTVVGAVYWWTRSGSSDPPATVDGSTGDATAHASRQSPGQLPVEVDSANRLRELPDASVDAPLSGAAVTELSLGFDDAHDRLRNLMAPCFADSRPPKGSRLVFRYRLLVAEKQATLETPQIVESDFELGAARACILAALDEATWPTSLPDLDTPIEDQLLADEL